MTVSTTISSTILPGNGVVTQFAFTFEIPYQDDGTTPAVLVNTVTGTITTPVPAGQYTISGVENPLGGVVTYPLVGPPLPSGSWLEIIRNKDLTQPSAFPNQGFLPSNVEAALDIIVLEMQQLGQVVGVPPQVHVGTPVFATVADAAASPMLASNYQAINTQGYISPGDGGGALYVHSPGNASVTYGGFMGADGVWWVITASPLGELPVIAFTGIPDGVTDNSAALTAADARAQVLAATLFFGSIPNAVPWVINTNVSIMNATHWQRYARISIAPTVTLTLGSFINANRTLLFEGGGAVVATQRCNTIGYPEWFGAAGNLPASDCSAGINSCIATFPITELAAKAYYIQAPIIMNVSNRVLRGVGETQDVAGGVNGPGNGIVSPTATQIIVVNTAATPNTNGMIIGNSGGAGPFPFITFNRVEDIMFVTATAAVPLGVTGPRQVQAGGIGINASWVINLELRRVGVTEFAIGFLRYATIECYSYNCTALRYTPGLPAATDSWVGFKQDNSANIGLNSGNASCYYRDCRAFSNFTEAGSPGYPGGSYAFQFYQGFTDSYITAFECGNVGWGIFTAGRGTGATNYQTEDLIIQNCVLDGVRFAAFHLEQAGPDTAVQILGCYMGLSSASTPGSIGCDIESTSGSVVMTGCQIVALPNNSAIGLNVNSPNVYGVSGVLSSNNIYTDIANPIVLNNVGNVSVVNDRINAAQLAPVAQGILMTNCGRGKIDAAIYPSNPLIAPIGVNMAGTNNLHFEICVSQIDTTAVTHKLVFNGTPVNVIGPIAGGTTNLVTGNFS